jgi:hypothetical protein
MDQEVLERLTKITQRHMKDKWKSPNCILCDKNNWAIAGLAFHNAEFVLRSDNKPAITPKLVPVLTSVGVICRNCGNTHMISAAMFDDVNEIDDIIEKALLTVVKVA